MEFLNQLAAGALDATSKLTDGLQVKEDVEKIAQNLEIVLEKSGAIQGLTDKIRGDAQTAGLAMLDAEKRSQVTVMLNETKDSALEAMKAIRVAINKVNETGECVRRVENTTKVAEYMGVNPQDFVIPDVKDLPVEQHVEDIAKAREHLLDNNTIIMEKPGAILNLLKSLGDGCMRVKDICGEIHTHSGNLKNAIGECARELNPVAGIELVRSKGPAYADLLLTYSRDSEKLLDLIEGMVEEIKNSVGEFPTTLEGVGQFVIKQCFNGGLSNLVAGYFSPQQSVENTSAAENTPASTQVNEPVVVTGRPVLKE